MRRPLVAFDGDCGFCRRFVERWRVQVPGADFEPSQTARAKLPKIPAELFDAAVVLVEPDGRFFSGAQAVFRLLALGGSGFWRAAYEHLPAFAPLSETAYAFVAARRAFFSRAARRLYGDDLRPASTRGARAVFLGLLAITYFCAFASLWSQIDGLLGPDGILPAARYLEAARAQLGAAAYLAVPSAFWLGASAAALKAACAAGAALAVLALCGIAQGPALLALWALYLSVVAVGQEFLSFQWDVLLLEAGFLALLIVPWEIFNSRDRREPPALGVWLLRFLAARLMLESGLVKLGSGDRTWRDLTALTFHYQTQPLPTWLGWWAHQLPLWAQKGSCAALFAVELAAPLLFALPRRPRALAAAAFIFLQILIALTGNYGFFNLLAVALALTLLDDRQLGLKTELGERASRPRRACALAFAAFSLPLALAQLCGVAFGRVPLPRPMTRLYGMASPLHLVNGYGLFAFMTTRRDEITVEGSLDGREWREYPFKFKPGALDRRPPFVAPRMPRLDWQMWFAALGSYEDSPWFMALLARLAVVQSAGS